MTSDERANARSGVRQTAGRIHRSRRQLAGLGVLALAVVIVAYAISTQSRAAGSPNQPGGPVATAVVTRGTIEATTSRSGTLGYGAPVTIASRTDGVVTRLPTQGDVKAFGDVLYHLNERPVTLLRGVVPMFRDLTVGDSGTDVWQLQENLAALLDPELLRDRLAALGFDDFAINDQYTYATAEAVKLWQETIGVQPTGDVSLGDVVFLSEAGSIGALHVGVGSMVTPRVPILDLIGAEQVVTVETHVRDRNQFEVGAEVTVALPGDDQVTGHISLVSVQEPAAGGQGGEAVLVVEVILSEHVPDAFVGGPADVIVATDRREDVLVVPVSALLALTGGGHGLEVVAGDEVTTIVPVETGLFARGMVEVRGDGIDEGTVVGVAGR